MEQKHKKMLDILESKIGSVELNYSVFNNSWHCKICGVERELEYITENVVGRGDTPEHAIDDFIAEIQKGMIFQKTPNAIYKLVPLVLQE